MSYYPKAGSAGPLLEYCQGTDLESSYYHLTAQIWAHESLEGRSRISVHAALQGIKEMQPVQIGNAY
ncbi:MAG: hypothetical protein JRN15_15820 [Nitrososphaerota archaeon]|nr:hypothetical protein [Nitrososphaerota archaeon]